MTLEWLAGARARVVDRVLRGRARGRQPEPRGAPPPLSGAPGREPARVGEAHRAMPSLEAKRTLVKSPPEIWAEVSDAGALARHLGEFGEIRITRTQPESVVEWEGDLASGCVRLEPSGWGTKVTLTAEAAEPPAPEPEPEPEPEPVAPGPSGPSGAASGAAARSPSSRRPLQPRRPPPRLHRRRPRSTRPARRPRSPACSTRWVRRITDRSAARRRLLESGGVSERQRSAAS